MTDPVTSSFRWRSSFSASLPALLTAICFAISPALIRLGLELLPSPLMGATIGVLASAIVYGFVFFPHLRRKREKTYTGEGALSLLIAGACIALSTWLRWIALALVPVAVVLALGRISVLVVVIFTLLGVTGQKEMLSWRTWFGILLILVGTVTLLLFQ